MRIKYKVVKEASITDLITLYKEADWWDEKNDDPSFLTELVRKTYCFVGAFDNSRMIGMGRSISDSVSDAYIQDVTVLKKYRNQGIGGQIINTLINYLLENNIKWIGLIGEPGTESFYKQLSFKKMQNYIPMIYKN